MGNSEFDIIEEFFRSPSQRDDVDITIGDDCASVSVPADKQLLITTDTLISGVHFPEGTAPEDIAYKAIMVNLSDLAAMGAVPAWITLAITLPEVDRSWLSRFSGSLHKVLDRYNVALIGGDTTRGPLSLTVQAMGLAGKGAMLRRDAAVVGDKVYVSGTIGDAAIGLMAVEQALCDAELKPCIDSLNRPEPKIRFAERLTVICACAIDISDGLAADLGHILKRSRCGADISLSSVPLSPAALYYFERYGKSGIDWSVILGGGDDYELCFTVPSASETELMQLAEETGTPICCIGEITRNPGLRFYDATRQVELEIDGYKHF